MGGSEDERESDYDSIDPLRDANATELNASTLIIRAGANRCNIGYRNVREGLSGRWQRERGLTTVQVPREMEYRREEGVKAKSEEVPYKSKKEEEQKEQAEEKDTVVETLSY